MVPSSASGPRPGSLVAEFDRLFREGTVSGLSEPELLDRFVERGDSVAFEALVRRHGPMVLAVCRGVLGDPHDAEDAFQATFLVLARKAGSINRRRPIGPWLSSVAYRVASKARVTEARRRRREAEAARRNGDLVAEPSSDDPELAPVVWQELTRLPRKYREPVLLCWVEGQSHEQAAAELKWPVGTVKGRLHRAKRRLQDRLTRRGITGPTVGLAAWLARRTAEAALPAKLLDSTVSAATAFAVGGTLAAGAVSASTYLLARDTVTAMMLGKLLSTTTALACAGGLTATGLGALAWSQAGDGEGPQDAKTDPPAVVAVAGNEDEAIEPDDLLAAADPRPQDRFGKFGPPPRQEQPADTEEQEPEREDDAPEEKPPIDPNDIEALKQQRVEAAQKRLDALHSSYRDGNVNIDRVLAASRALMNAEYDLAASAEERLEAIEVHQEFLSNLVEQERVKPGSSRADLMEALAELRDVQLLAALVRQGEEPFVIGYTHRLSARPGEPKAEFMDGMAGGMMGMGSGGTRMGMMGGAGGMGMGGSGRARQSAEDREPRSGAVSRTEPEPGTRGSVNADPNNPRTQAVLDSLDQIVSMPFSNDTPLVDCLDYLQDATANTEFLDGLPFYLDPVGLEEAELTEKSPVRLRLESIPLKTSLWLALDQLGLAYTVIDGLVIISTPERLEEMLISEPIYSLDVQRRLKELEERRQEELRRGRNSARRGFQ